MSHVLVLLQMFDDNWSHHCESLLSILQGVASEESSWQGPGYTAERSWKDFPSQERFVGRSHISNIVPDVTLKFFANDQLHVSL
jgi:hypothetical protein